MSDFDFQDYLSAIAQHYAQQRHLYTLTHVLLPLEARWSPTDQRSTVEENKEGQDKKIEQFPVLAGLRKYALGDAREHVLLAGRPGSGKSTALRQLVVELAADGLVPVLVQLKGDRTVPELIKAEFRARKVRVTDEQIEDWLVADRLILLLDGVNEMPTEELRRSLAQFREDNRTVPMIFTTRDLSLGGDLGIGKRLEMKPLSPEQLKEFVGKQLGENGDRLLGQLRGKLPELAETPLLLKMLCNVFDPETGKIPKSKGELFQWFDRDYERVKKGVEYVPVSENFWLFKAQILQHLAFITIQAAWKERTEPAYTFSRGQAATILEDWLRDRGMADAPTRAALWIKDLVNYHLLQDAAEPGEIEFHHQLFQEYYAAEALLGMFRDRHPDVVEPERFQHFYLNYLKWTESVAIVLSLMENEKTAVDVVKQALDVDMMLGARLAGAVRSDFQNTIEGLVDKFNAPSWLKSHHIHSFNYSNSNGLGFFPAGWKLPLIETSSQALLKLVANPNSSYDDIWSEADALGSTDSDTTIPALLKLLESDNSDIRWRATVALGLTGSSNRNDVIPVLLKLLKDLDSNVRRFAVGALGEIGSDIAIPPLIEFIINPCSDVRSEAVEASGKIGSEKAIPALLELLTASDSSISFDQTAHSCLRIAKKNRGGIARYLSQFQTLIPANSGQHIYRVIEVIQYHCKFYNYEIFHSPPAKPQPTQQSPPSVTYNINQVGNLNTGTVNIQGHQIGKSPPI